MAYLLGLGRGNAQTAPLVPGSCAQRSGYADPPPRPFRCRRSIIRGYLRADCQRGGDLYATGAVGLYMLPGVPRAACPRPTPL